jgi:hypothetical protein
MVNELSQSIERTSSLYAERDTVVDKRAEDTADLDKLFTVARKQHFVTFVEKFPVVDVIFSYFCTNKMVYIFKLY